MAIRMATNMPDRKYKDRNTRKIFKKGGSFSLSVPIEIIKSLGWKEKQKVVVKKIKGGFVARDWKR